MNNMTENDKIIYTSHPFRLNVRTAGQCFDVVMVYAELCQKLDISSQDFLDEQDRKYIEVIRRKELRQDVALGRFAAKEAVAELICVSREEVKVRKGIFNQPIVSHSTMKENVQISVSHGRGHAVAIAYPEELIMGIDMELRLGEDKAEALKLSLYEEALIDELKIDKTFIWVIREALIKCLKISVFFPPDMMEVYEIKKKENICLGSFRVFRQYRFYAYRLKERFIAIVYPERTKIDHKKTIT